MLVVSTNNIFKYRELKDILLQFDKRISIKGIFEMGLKVGEVGEPYSTYMENALHKARAISQWLKVPILSEDSGLEVDALGGKPGIYSRRYAASKGDLDNISLLLNEMKGIVNRTAKFICWVCFLLPEGEYYLFSGELRGKISMEPEGDEGFGYDPIFIPEGYDKTLAALGYGVKNSISHRRAALAHFFKFIEEYNFRQLLY